MRRVSGVLYIDRVVADCTPLRNAMLAYSRVPFCTAARSQFNARRLTSLSPWPLAAARPVVPRDKGAVPPPRSNIVTRSFSNHEEVWGNESGYEEYRVARAKTMERLLNGPNRFQRIDEREDRSDYPVEGIKAHCMGKYFINHRGCQVMKNADDMIIYQQLLWNLRPATVIELGTFTGGSAIWLADMLRLMEIPSQIFSMDITHSNIEECVSELKPDNITFLLGDSYKIEETFTPNFLKRLPRPWLVIDDAHSNIYGILEHFDRFMETGDYFVVEDLNPSLPIMLGFGRMYEGEYEPAGASGLKILKQFLSNYSEKYAVDSFYTDFFGYNGTWNWHGYIRHM